MIDDVVLTLSVILGAGLVARFVADLLRIPEMLVMIAVGALLGPAVIDAIDVPLDALGAQLVFTLGVSIILFYGGLNLSLRVLRQTAVSLGMLAVPGVIVTALIVAVTTHFAFGFSWTESMLLGAVLAPTDPAILIPLFTASRVKAKVAQTVIAESAFNDPVSAVLALTLAGILLGGGDASTRPVLEFILNLAISTGVGIVAGFLLSATISSHRAGIWRESPVIAVTAVVSVSYFSLDSAGASGYLGAFIAGLIVGNMEMFGLAMHSHHKREMKEFVHNLAEIVTLFIFVILGINLPFAEIADEILPAVAVLATLLLIARPVAIFLCTTFDRRAQWSRGEQLFLCWTRETGVVPVALVGILAGMGTPDSPIFLAVVTLAIVITLTVQALPAPWLAKRLGILEDDSQPSDGLDLSAAVK